MQVRSCSGFIPFYKMQVFPHLSPHRLRISEVFSTLVFALIGFLLLVAIFTPYSTEALGNAAAFKSVPKPPTAEEVENNPDVLRKYRVEFTNYLKMLKLLGIPA